MSGSISGNFNDGNNPRGHTLSLIIILLAVISLMMISTQVCGQENNRVGTGDLIQKINDNVKFDPSLEERAMQVEFSNFLFNRSESDLYQLHKHMVILEKAPYERRALLAATLGEILESPTYKSLKLAVYQTKDNKLLVSAYQSEFLGDYTQASYLHAERNSLARRMNIKMKHVGDYYIDRVRCLSRARDYNETFRLIQRYQSSASTKVKIHMNDILAGLPDEYLKFQGETYSGVLASISEPLGSGKYVKFTIKTPQGKTVKFLVNQLETIFKGKKMNGFLVGDRIKAIVSNYFAKLVKFEED